MKKVLVDNIDDKMILAKEVCGSSGNVLLGIGAALNPALGRRLKNWGIHFVFIEGEEEEALIADTVKVSPEEIKSHLEDKFSNVMNNIVMKKIFAAAYQMRVQKGTR